jgi:hypothetical protein
MPHCRLAGMDRWIDRADSHNAHQSLDPLDIDLVSHSPQTRQNPTTAIKRMLSVQRIDHIHQHLIVSILRLWFIVITGAIKL